MARSSPRHTITKELFDAVLFDLDGVLTDTAKVHVAAWKQLFDEFLRMRAEQADDSFVPFDPQSDYPLYVDGRLRYDGVRSFLDSRGIRLPDGEPGAPPGFESVIALGNMKDGRVQEILAAEGVEAYEDSVSCVQHLRRLGIKTAVVSASRNCQEVLRAAGIESLFDVRVDGEVVERFGLRGKPAPDSFLEAARELDVKPERAVVVEDALSGVQAGRAGGFGLVIGVDRKGSVRELEEHGADRVVSDLRELFP